MGRVSTGMTPGTAPDPAFEPPERSRRVGTVDMFIATPDAGLGSAKTNTDLSAQLSGGMMSYDWTINGRPFTDTQPLSIPQGQRATLRFTNMSMMWHPMHLHGHTFEIIRPDGSPGARKDTVLAMQKLDVALVADNPSVWMLHCHNTYHQEAGMMTSLNYTT
jgi:multicopper oxidase